MATRPQKWIAEGSAALSAIEWLKSNRRTNLTQIDQTTMTVITPDESSDLSPGAKMMVEDGLPSGAVVPQQERNAFWKTQAAKAKQTENVMTTETTPSKADQVKALREKKAAKNSPAAKAPKKAQAAAGPKAAKKVTKAAPAKKKTEGGVRPGSKLELIVGLLTRKQGCTTADVLEATDWPAVSMPQQAKSAGLKLRKEKVKGEPTRYFGTAA